MFSTTPAEYSSVKVLNADELPTIYDKAINLAGVNPTDFPSDKTVMFYRTSEKKSRLELVSGNRFMSIENRNGDTIVIRDIDLANDATGVEEIISHDGSHTTSNIRVQKGSHGKAEYATFGAPISHETGQVEFCQSRIQAARNFMYAVDINFLSMYLDKNGGVLSYRGADHPDIVKAFVDAMGLDKLSYKPSETTIELRQQDCGEVRLVRAVSDEVSATIELDSENGFYLRLVWQGQAGGSSTYYHNLTNTVTRSDGRLVESDNGLFFQERAAGFSESPCDIDIQRKAAAYQLYSRILEL